LTDAGYSDIVVRGEPRNSIERNMPTPFRTIRRVDFVDTDMAGIVHFSNFFRYMESAEVEFLRGRGLTVSQAAEGERTGFPRVSAACDYIKPATFGDVLEIVVRLEKIGTKSVTYQHEFFRDGELIARGKISAVYCRSIDGHQLEALPIPPDVRAKLEQ
jgi:YbgC/YbaW family acyl-CoA thioester hydrolase